MISGGQRRRVLISQRVVIDPSTNEPRDALAHDWAAWLSRFDLDPVPVCNAMRDPASMLRTLAPVGLILTGGGDIGEFDVSAAGPYAQSTVESLAPMRLRDRTESRLLSAALNAGIPVLAVCRGMQFVNRYFGGRVRSGISAPRGSHTKAGGEHRVRIDTNAAPQELSKLQPHATVRSYHDDGVLPADVAPSLAPWAWADDDVVEALSHTTHAVIGVQWHPEREPDHPWSAALMEPMVKRSRSQ